MTTSDTNNYTTSDYGAMRVALPGVGAPSIGKGSRFTDMARLFPQASTVSTGDLMRKYAAGQKPDAAEIAAVLKHGGLVSDDKLLEMVGDYVVTTQHAARPFLLLDGAPRTRHQAERLHSVVPVGAVLYFHLDRLSVEEQNDVLLQRQQFRIDARRREGKPVRSDDTPETLLGRISEYRKQLPGILDHYANAGVEVIGIDSIGAPEEINRIFARELERIVTRHEPKAAPSQVRGGTLGADYARVCISGAYG